ncbi:hypothetical protein KCU99_g4240, partial [Aureobasidium melanogenum]
MASNLPPEILHLVLCHIREQQGPKALLPSTLVCRTWKDISCRTLYAHVVLTNENLKHFIDSAVNNPEHLTAIKSLTLKLQAIILPVWIEDAELRESYRRDGLEGTRALLYQLRRVAGLVLPRIVNLNTFSLFVFMPKSDGRRPRLDYIGFRIDNEVLGQLLRALPTSCVNLEVDTAMSNWSPQKKPHHVCSDLWHVLPQMRHVKLRMQSLCSRMLYINHEDPDDRLAQPDMTSPDQLDEQRIVKADQLRTLTICTRSRDGAGPLFVECDYLQWNLDLGVQEPWGSINGRVQSFAVNLAATYQAGRFPKAEKLALSEPWFRFPDREKNARKNERAQIYRNVMLLRDGITNTTIPQPIRRIENIRSLALYDRTDTCLIGERKDLLEHAEDTIWRETIYGARMPFCAHLKPLKVELQPPPSFMTKEEWCQSSEFVMVGWRKEELQGQKIQRAKPLSGAGADFRITKMPLLKGTQMPGRLIAYFGGIF